MQVHKYHSNVHFKAYVNLSVRKKFNEFNLKAANMAVQYEKLSFGEKR